MKIDNAQNQNALRQALSQVWNNDAQSGSYARQAAVETGAAWWQRLQTVATGAQATGLGLAAHAAFIGESALRRIDVAMNRAVGHEVDLPAGDPAAPSPLAQDLGKLWLSRASAVDRIANKIDLHEERARWFLTEAKASHAEATKHTRQAALTLLQTGRELAQTLGQRLSWFSHKGPRDAE